MKRFLFLLAICSTTTSAQFERGKIEITLTGTAGYQKNNLPAYLGNSESRGYVMLNTSIGYYLFDGLSIEPQLGLLAIENSFPSQSVLLNLSYTHRISTSPIALFVRGGYGISNSLSFPFVGLVPIRINSISNVRIINAGAGVKILVTENVALNFEMNYRKETFGDQVPNGMFYLNGTIAYLTKTVDYTYSYVGMLFGFSILL